MLRLIALRHDDDDDDDVDRPLDILDVQRVSDEFSMLSAANTSRIDSRTFIVVIATCYY